jgi:hypothetical protein
VPEGADCIEATARPREACAERPDLDVNLARL